jgi:hypothetical protein
MKIIPIISTIIVSVVVTTLGIGASDVLNGRSGSLLGQLIGATPAVCEEGMTEVESALTFTCIDTFEASASPTCVYQNPSSLVETTANKESAVCSSQSVKGATPWRFVTRADAQLFCARSGKRLPTAAEWYEAAIGTPSTACNLSSNILFPTGKQVNCLSAFGVSDAVGNVWEWTSDDVIDGQYNNRPLPDSGYVRQVDSGGVATESKRDTSEELFDNDYLWSNPEGSYGIIRGGFYGSGDDGGVFTVQAMTSPNFRGGAIGFRCIR